MWTSASHSVRASAGSAASQASQAALCGSASSGTATGTAAASASDLAIGLQLLHVLPILVEAGEVTGLLVLRLWRDRRHALLGEDAGRVARQVAERLPWWQHGAQPVVGATKQQELALAGRPEADGAKGPDALTRDCTTDQQLGAAHACLVAGREATGDGRVGAERRDRLQRHWQRVHRAIHGQLLDSVR